MDLLTNSDVFLPCSEPIVCLCAIAMPSPLARECKMIVLLKPSSELHLFWCLVMCCMGLLYSVVRLNCQDFYSLTFFKYGLQDRRNLNKHWTLKAEATLNCISCSKSSITQCWFGGKIYWFDSNLFHFFAFPLWTLYQSPCLSKPLGTCAFSFDKKIV